MSGSRSKKSGGEYDGPLESTVKKRLKVWSKQSEEDTKRIPKVIKEVSESGSTLVNDPDTMGKKVRKYLKDKK